MNALSFGSDGWEFWKRVSHRLARTVHKIVVTSSNRGNTSLATAFHDKRICGLWNRTEPVKMKRTYGARLLHQNQRRRWHSWPVLIQWWGDERILKLRPTLFAFNAWCEPLVLCGYCLPPGAGTMISFIMYVSSQSNNLSSIYSNPISLFCLLQRVASLSLTLQSTTFARQKSLLIWARQPVDDPGVLNFNLRFVQGAGQEDAGMAASGVHASSSQQSGSVMVVFPNEGYVGHGISSRSLAEMVKLGLMGSSLSMSEFFYQIYIFVWLHDWVVQATLWVPVTMLLQLRVLLHLQPLRRRYCKLFLFSVFNREFKCPHKYSPSASSKPSGTR